jgi:hypothetical protein
MSRDNTPQPPEDGSHLGPDDYLFFGEESVDILNGLRLGNYHSHNLSKPEEIEYVDRMFEKIELLPSSSFKISSNNEGGLIIEIQFQVEDYMLDVYGERDPLFDKFGNRPGCISLNLDKEGNLEELCMMRLAPLPYNNDSDTMPRFANFMSAYLKENGLSAQSMFPDIGIDLNGNPDHNIGYFDRLYVNRIKGEGFEVKRHQTLYDRNEKNHIIKEIESSCPLNVKDVFNEFMPSMNLTKEDNAHLDYLISEGKYFELEYYIKTIREFIKRKLNYIKY